MQELAELSLRIVYMPSLKNSVIDALGSQPGEAGYPDEGELRDSGSKPCVLQDPVVFLV